MALSIVPSSDAVWQVELLRTLSACAEIVPAWRALAARSPDATPFQSPEWTLGSLAHLGLGAPRVVVVREHDELVAVLPLATHDARTWVLAGTGPSDVLDVIADPLHAARATRGALAFLAERGGWEALELHELREHSPLLEAARSGIGGTVAQSGPMSISPVITVPEGARSLEDVVPASMARRARYALRRAAREGLEVVRATARDLDAHLASWRESHQARWRARGELGVLGDRERFDRAVIPSLVERGAAILWSLRDRGSIRASYLVLIDHARASFYLGGFDPAIASRSPLVVLIATAISELVPAGVRELDFLRGAEAYKYQWGARDRVLHRARIER